MPGAFDSHCHFEPGDDAPALLARARAAGISGLLAVGGEAEANRCALAAAAAAPDFALAAVGFEPGEAGLVSPEAAAAAIRRAAPRLAAVGEIGLDYSRGEDAAARAAQRALFAAQVSLAAELGLPCSIHSRDAADDTEAILRERLSPALVREARAGSLHCFVGPADFAERLAPLGLSFGLSGILTFRNAEALRTAVPALPRDRILVETDSPWLAPVPLRGRRCEPAFVVHTAAVLARLLGLGEEEAAALSARNALRLFRPVPARPQGV